MRSLTSFLAASVALFNIVKAGGHGGHGHHGCPPFNNGTFIIEYFQLYPENADFDGDRCVVYFGSLFNASLGIYDPYLDEMEIVEFPGITNNPSEHVGGVGWDQYTGLVSVSVDSPNPFITGGEDVSGDNFLIKFDPRNNQVVWKANLTATSNGVYGGHQDVEHDRRGNTYVVGTYPSSILRVDKTGRHVVPWYLAEPVNTTVRGYAGLAAKGDILLTNDNRGGAGTEIYRFDMSKRKGHPVLVPRTPSPPIGFSDAIYLPPKYHGTVLLVAITSEGVVVLRSKDGKWKSAEHLGLIPNDFVLAPDAIVPTTVQIGESIYIVEEFFTGPLVPGTNAGNRTEFPMYDITDQVEALLH